MVVVTLPRSLLPPDVVSVMKDANCSGPAVMNILKCLSKEKGELLGASRTCSMLADARSGTLHSSGQSSEPAASLEGAGQEGGKRVCDME